MLPMHPTYYTLANNCHIAFIFIYAFDRYFYPNWLQDILYTLSIHAFPGKRMHAVLLELQQCNIEMHVCVDEEGSGAVRAAAAADGCGGGRAQRGGKVHSVEDAAGGAGQDGPCGQTVHHEPKAMPRQQLLGHIDMDTREWSDGVLTSSARQVVREPQGEEDKYTY